MKWQGNSKLVYDYDCRRQFTREEWKDHEHSNQHYHYYVRTVKISGLGTAILGQDIPPWRLKIEGVR
jgi:hypothetical protein